MPAYSRILLPWDSQPQEVVEVRPELNPITGLQPGASGLVDTNGQPLTTVGSGITATVGKFGRELDFTSAGRLTRTGSVSGHPLSFVFAGRVDGASLGCISSIATTADKTTRVFGLDGAMYAQHIGATTYASAQTSAVWNYGTYWTGVAVFRSPTDVSVYANGNVGRSSATTTTNVGALGTLNKISYGQYDGSTNLYQLDGSIALAQWLGVALTENEAWALVDQVWSAFAPRSIWISVSAGGGGPTDYPATSAETVTASDTSSVLIGYASTASETGAASDTASNVASLSAIASEAGTALDAVSQVAALSAIASESASAADTVDGSAAGDYAATAPESATAADTSSQVAAFAGTVSESGTAIDTASNVAALSSTTTESATAADTVNGTATGDYAGTVSESGSAADTVSNVAALNGIASESASAADSAAAVRAVAALIAEAMSAADSVSASAAGDYYGVVTEVGSATDTTSQAAAMFGTVAESVTVADSAYVFNAWLASILETASAADAASQILNALVTNSAWWTYEVAVQNMRYSVSPQDLRFAVAVEQLTFTIER